MEEFFLKQAANGVWYGVFGPLKEAGLTHGVSTRLGGVSRSPYQSLNLGIGTKDDRENIWANRKLFCQALGLDAENAVTTFQVHQDKVHTVTPRDVGLRDRFYHTVLADTDALITNSPGIPLLLFFADCVPIIIYDPVKRAAGVCHAGWKGTMANIAAKTLRNMRAAFETNPADCLVGIGPSIGPCCYEVDEVVIDSLKNSFAGEMSADFLHALAQPHGAKWLLNLWATNKIKLQEAGIPKEKIILSSVCTACNTALFYSHRAEGGLTGRVGALVSL